MPATARALGVTDRTDPAQAIPGAAKYLAQGYGATGNWDDALRYYYGGPDKSKWGANTNAYPAQVKAHMQTAPIQYSPVAPPGMDPNDPMFSLSGQFQGTPNPPPMDSDNPQLDPNSLPALGNARGSSGFALSPAVQNAVDSGAPVPAGAPSPAFNNSPMSAPAFNGGMTFADFEKMLPTGSASDDPAFADYAHNSRLANTFSGNGLLGLVGKFGGWQSAADADKMRLGMAGQFANSDIQAQRYLQQQQNSQRTAAARMIASGVPPKVVSAMFPDIDSSALGADAQFSAKPMSSTDQKQEQGDLGQVSSVNQSRTRLEYFRDLIKAGKLHFYKGIGTIAPAENAVEGTTGVSIPGIDPDNSQNYQSFMSTIRNIQQDNLNSAKGVQTDKDAQREFDSLMPNMSNTQTVLNHLNNLINNYGSRENQIRTRVNSRRGAVKQPAFDWNTFDQSNPVPTPDASSQQLLSNPYTNNGGTDRPAGPNSGVGQGGGIGVTSKGTKYQIIGP
jgi:hypothetical protein